MEQQRTQSVDLEKIQSHLSRYRGDLRSIRPFQPDVRQTAHALNAEPDDLSSVYALLQSMHASIGQDIADLELLLLQSGQQQSGHQPAFEALGLNTLSCKENEVLNMFAKGYSYNEVASLLDCKLATIQTHAKRIYKKLHVHSRSEAVYEARQLDIIPA